jgi:hypothetical protein
MVLAAELAHLWPFGSGRQGAWDPGVRLVGRAGLPFVSFTDGELQQAGGSAGAGRGRPRVLRSVRFVDGSPAREAGAGVGVSQVLPDR